MGVYITKERVIVEDIGKDFEMNNRSFLRILQEAANRASTDVGHGITDIEKNKTTWVLLYWRIKILKRAKYNDELTIKTWANFTKKIYSIRSFEVYLEDELIAFADSKWVFVDANTHSILKIPDKIIQTYGQVEDRVFEDEFKDKFKLPDNLTEDLSYKTMKRDLDVNHHVNNIAYLDIANEMLPESLLLNATEIAVVYKKEIAYKDMVTCCYQNDTVYLYNKEKNILNGIIKIK